MANVGLISLGCAVMCVRAIQRGVSIKWPNDILDATGRKVGGILCECVPSHSGADCYVMGVGINLRDAPQLDTASALRVAADDAPELCLALAMSLLEVPRWAADDPDGLVEAWRTHAHTLGRTVAIGATRGVAQDIDQTGALLVETKAGPQRILAGDVTMIEHHGARE